MIIFYYCSPGKRSTSITPKLAIAMPCNSPVMAKHDHPLVAQYQSSCIAQPGKRKHKKRSSPTRHKKAQKGTKSAAIQLETQIYSLLPSSLSLATWLYMCTRALQDHILVFLKLMAALCQHWWKSHNETKDQEWELPMSQEKKSQQTKVNIGRWWANNSHECTARQNCIWEGEGWIKFCCP